MNYFKQTFENIISKNQLDIILEGRNEEYIFPLIQLGYLHKDYENKTGGDRLILRTALKLFRQEYQECQLIKEELYFDDLTDYNLQFYEPSPIEIKLLHQLTSLDGSFHIQYQCIEKYNLFKRILNFQLNLLHLSHLSIKEAKNHLNLFFNTNHDNLSFELISNIPAAIKHLITNEIDLPSLPFSSSIDSKKKSSTSRKIIQILLWIYGYYDGKIDSILANHTLKAIQKVLEQENVKTEDYIIKNENNSILYTNKFLLLFYNRIIKEKSDLGAVARLIDQYLEKENKREEGNSLINTSWSNEIEKRKENFNQGRPTYFGTNTIVQSVRRQFRTFYKKVKTVATQTINFMKQLFETIHSAVQLFYREIREGLKVFQLGINFLFGEKEIITHFNDQKVAYTYLDKDFDMKNYFSVGCGQKNIVRHNRHCQRHINALKYSLNVCSKILPWVISYKNPITWTRLSFQIAIEVRNVFNDYLLQKTKDVLLNENH